MNRDQLLRLLLALCVLFPAMSRAQEPDAEGWKRLYQETVEQLKAAQDRKNELSQENEKLRAQLAEMQAQIQQRDAEVSALRKQASEFAERTYYLRLQNAAWRDFVKRWPELQEKWRQYLEIGLSEFPAPLGDDLQ